MTEEWEGLIGESLSADVTTVKKSWEDIDTARRQGATGTPPDLAGLLARAVMENQSPEDWAGPVGFRSLVEAGIYSPIQLLLYYCAKLSGDCVSHDYPFLFDSIGQLISQLVTRPPPEDEAAEEPPAPEVPVTPQDYCKAIQAIFQLREMQEEGEPLSLEVHLPFKPGVGPSLPIKKLAQIFGRGVGLANGSRLNHRVDPKGGVEFIFPDHKEAPATLLYGLLPTYQKIPGESIGLILRRDRVTTIAKVGNPLLEFYDGGWHVVDLNSGQGLINLALDDHFDRNQNQDLAEVVLRLAYHMANHWHSGILAVVNVEALDAARILEPPKQASIDVTEIIKSEVLRADKSRTTLKITDVRQTQMGRVFLTNAIQDGAVLLRPDGEFHSAGRFVMSIRADAAAPPATSGPGGSATTVVRPLLGSGNRAARQLAQFGVALKISQDGAIRVYSNPPTAPGRLQIEGRRIR